MTEREFATDVVRRLRDAGFDALFAGGCVRDALFGLEPDDFDVATSATPDQVRRLFPKTIAVGVSFGVVEVLGKKPLKVQVATFRSDGTYSDGRRPDAVQFSTPQDDAARRDFTINGMFFDPLSGAIIDYVDGQADFERRILRAIGDPVARFAEDRLRLLRAVRFAARFDLTINPSTWSAVRSMAATVVSVSGERIAEELRKLLMHPSRRRGMQLLHESGLWAVLLPESRGSDADLDQLGTKPGFPLSLSAAVGEVTSQEWIAIAGRLRLANHDRDRLQWFAKHRSDVSAPQSLPAHRLKPLLAHPGRDDLLRLGRALGHDDAVKFLEEKLAQWPAEVLDPPPLVTGEDLIARGLTPGPAFKTTLDAIRRAQLDGELVTRAAALATIGSV